MVVTYPTSKNQSEPPGRGAGCGGGGKLIIGSTNPTSTERTDGFHEFDFKKPKKKGTSDRGS